MANLEIYVGTGAGILTAVSLLPQLVKVIREKNGENISFFYLSTLLAGLCLWVGYGILKNDYPIMLTNSFSALVNITLIIYLLIYKKRQKS